MHKIFIHSHTLSECLSNTSVLPLEWRYGCRKTGYIRSNCPGSRRHTKTAIMELHTVDTMIQLQFGFNSFQICNWNVNFGKLKFKSDEATLLLPYQRRVFLEEHKTVFTLEGEATPYELHYINLGDHPAFRIRIIVYHMLRNSFWRRKMIDPWKKARRNVKAPGLHQWYSQFYYNSKIRMQAIY